MATRSLIFIKNEDESYDYIYCHHNGDFENNGVILSKYYNSTEKVRKLISLGDMSLLDKNIEPSTNTHSFSHPEDGVCIFYNRDRGESDVTSHHLESNQMKEFNYYAAYNYLWSDNEWWYARTLKTGGIMWIKLSERPEIKRRLNYQKKKPETIDRKTEDIINKLTESEKDYLYRKLWMSYVIADIESYAENELCMDLTEKAIKLAAKLYVYGGKYDCNLSYWQNIENVIRIASEQP